MRVAAFVAAAIAAAPGVGSGQWRARPMVLPAPPGAEVLLGRFSAPIPGDEILVVDRATGAGVLHAHRALLSRSAWPFAFPAGTALRAGRSRDAGTDPLADVGYSIGTGVHIVYGAQPGTPVLVWGTGGLPSFGRALPGGGSVLVYPSLDFGSGGGSIWVWDFEGGVNGGILAWLWDGMAPLEVGEHELFGVRLSLAAQALGMEDLALPTSGGVVVVAHRPATADLRYATSPARPADLQMTPVTVGGPSAEVRPPWLPATIDRKGDVLGAGALEVDGDDVPDLVFTYGSTLDVPDGQGGFVPGRLVVVRGTGDPLDFAWPAGTWQDITARADIQPLVDPVILRPVTVNGAPAVAVWDRDLDQVIVISREAGGGGLRTWRGDAAGRRVRDIRMADVVGGGAPDLVVLAEDLLVFPDLEASPVLAWSPGSPGAPVRGSDHLLSVAASDPNDPVTVEWFVGDPYGVPVATSIVPAGAGETVTLLRPGATLCDPPPQTLAVTVRATDGFGVFDELSATLDVAFPPPALVLAGSTGGRLALPPGGASATFDGSAPGGCGPAVSFTWGGTLFDAGPSFLETGTATTTRRTVDLPEPFYPSLLAEAVPGVTLRAVDGGAASPLASLDLAIEAGGLVEVVEHSADVARLAPGELAVVRTVLRSRLGIPLPGVRVVGVLSGLAPAAAPRVAGAALAGASGADVVLAELPGGGAEVVVEVAVRSTGGRGASSVEVRSAGGHLLTPAASRWAGGSELPGCGCGSTGAGAGVGLLLLALASRRARGRRDAATIT